MTAPELIGEVKAAGGKVELAPGGRICVTHAPRHLASELKQLRPEIIRHLEQENFERLKRVFNLKPVTWARMEEITGGQPWQILNTRPRSEWKTRYCWQRVCHEGACDAQLETPAGQICSRCYPFFNRTFKNRTPKNRTPKGDLRYRRFEECDINFQAALLDYLREVFGEGPCYVCGQRAPTHVGVHFYSEKYLKRIGRKSPGELFYRVCDECSDSPEECAIRVEEKLIAEYEAWQRSKEGQGEHPEGGQKITQS
jgi:hypothetical protein